MGEKKKLGTPGEIRNYGTAKFVAVWESTGRSFWNLTRIWNWIILFQQQSIGF